MHSDIIQELVTRLGVFEAARRLREAYSKAGMLTFAAVQPIAATRNEEELRACAKFLEELDHMGTRPESLAVLEDAYWQLLRMPIVGVWESKPVILPGTGVVDRENVAAAIREATVPGMDISAEVYAWADDIGKKQWSGGIDAGVRMKQAVGPTIGEMIRVAAFIELARQAGIDADQVPRLRDLVRAQITQPSEDESESTVRRMLGISSEEWAKEGVISMSAPRLRAHEDPSAEMVRHQLGISREDWDKVD